MNVAADVETIVGLEIHVQLLTSTKLFCGCSTRFGSPANTQTCPVCTGMPGALPVLNAPALELAIRAGIALNCEIEQRTKWDRKNYFYPDLPKGYQISQFDRPICRGGWLELVDSQGNDCGRKIRFERAHLEEDAGKSLHDESGAGGKTRIDLNRAGTPLLEIVTKPDLRGATEAKDFLTELKQVLIFAEVSDCNMQQGNLRVDANVNLQMESSVATPIVEIKNLNSFRAVERAINHESERQLQRFREDGLTIDDAPKQTRGWDDTKQVTVPQREKEESADYRYFPDPDLLPIRTTQEQIESIRKQIGNSPAHWRAELRSKHQLTSYDADVLVRQGPELIIWFDEVARKVGNSKLVSNWIQQDVLRFLNDNNQTIERYPVAAEQFAELLIRIENRSLDQSRARDVLEAMVGKSIDVKSACEQLGIVAIDDSEIEDLCRRLIAENEAAVNDVRGGNTKAIGALIGQARKLNPNANPGLVKEMLEKLISG